MVVVVDILGGSIMVVETPIVKVLIKVDLSMCSVKSVLILDMVHHSVITY